MHTSNFDLDSSIEHISHWLPSQGPIKDFIHHNTLHAVQNYPFHEGVSVAAKTFGARSYLPLSDYQKLFHDGRIKQFALDWALARADCSQRELDKIRSTLFDIDHTGHFPPVSLANQGIRNSWLSQIEVDLNSLVHPVLFRLLSNFLDQGISRWSLPKPKEHFWDCVIRLTQNSLLPLYPLNDSAISLLMAGTPDDAIYACLQRIVGKEQLFEQYLLEMLLAHPGWAGMVNVIEQNPKALLARRHISLKQLIAVELLLELAFMHKKKGTGFANLAKTPIKPNTPLLNGGSIKPAVPLRLKIWHEAMEWALHTELLVTLAPNQEKTATNQPAQVDAQALFCIDDRECSLRRYLEEVNPHIDTYGAAGFFGIDFLYQGLDDAYPVAQCPNIIVPKHLIKEHGSQPRVINKHQKENLKHAHFSAHSIFRGWLYTQTIGLGYAFRMAWNVFSPGAKLPNVRKLSELETHSQLHLLRESDEPTEDGYLLGFSYTEMADRVGGLLRNIGLTNNFASLVVIVAHGSSSVNNPHFAAYDCGACSGKPGAPNARAFAWMANQPQVREILREREIDIPDGTLFVAALHNTSRDEISYFDLESKDHHKNPALQHFQHDMHKALQRNARERCRWFELGPQSHSNVEAHHHVIERASSIFEPRPELNHSNNLYCIVGRRSLSKDLFLDRRAFLHSYDPKSDFSGDILVRILSAIIPVCGGINLEYLFSRVDNSVYGAGTKLPHNVIGLLGVANGVEGDLRTGLPSQMIEVHEPARLLILIEQSREIMDKTISKIGTLKEWLDNEWVRLVSCHPDTRELSLYSKNGWQPVDIPTEVVAPTASHSEQIIIGKTKTIPVQKMTRRHA